MKLPRFCAFKCVQTALGGKPEKPARSSANLNHRDQDRCCERSDAASGMHASGDAALSRIKSEGSGDRRNHPDIEVEAGSLGQCGFSISLFLTLV